MASFTVTTHIDAGCDVVFERLTDLENLADVVAAIISIEVLTEGPIGAGTRFKETRKMFGKEASEEMEILTFDPPNGYSTVAQSCGCRYITERTLRAKGDGTDLEMSFSSEPLAFLGKVMSLLFGFMVKSMKKMCQKDLDDVRAAVESQVRS